MLSDHPVKYVIGSGNLAKTYVVEMDGFLCESPITWYETEQRWDLSPGFNTEFHDGFQRPVNSHCVNCHAGDAKPVDGSAHKIAFSEFGISCERCHGPGSIHATARSAESHVGDAGDLTIVNPRRLDRELSEAVCATCHLDTVATSDVRGRHRNDFRPGQRLGDFRVDYRLKSGSDSMSVVGHVEQMRMSRCYTESEVLTCISCHNPHYEPPMERRFEYFRQKCLDCHNVDACGVNATVRQKTKPADNCVSCHMPTSDTEVPHVASTHHRIGIHAPSRSDSQDVDEAPGELVAISDVSHLSAADQNRCLGLAYLEFSYKHEDDDLANTYRQRAHSLLMDAYERGLRDGELLVGLSRVHRFIDLTAAIRFAKAALAANDLSADSRANALSTLGLSLFDQGKHGEAAVALERFVEIQRHAGGWFVLGMCRQSLRDWSGAQRAAEMASRIGTDVPAFYEFAATLAEQNGQQAEARRLMYRARLLSQ